LSLDNKKFRDWLSKEQPLSHPLFHLAITQQRHSIVETSGFLPITNFRVVKIAFLYI
jgi:hypothetical protein